MEEKAALINNIISLPIGSQKKPLYQHPLINLKAAKYQLSSFIWIFF